MEQCCVANAATFCFARPVYADGTSPAAWLELGVIRCECSRRALARFLKRRVTLLEEFPPGLQRICTRDYQWFAVMLRGASRRIDGLKIPCGPKRGTRVPSKLNPRASTSRGMTSPWSRRCSPRYANAAARTRASIPSSKGGNGGDSRLERETTRLYVWRTGRWFTVYRGLPDGLPSRDL